MDWKDRAIDASTKLPHNFIGQRNLMDQAPCVFMDDVHRVLLPGADRLALPILIFLMQGSSAFEGGGQGRPGNDSVIGILPDHPGAVRDRPNEPRPKGWPAPLTGQFSGLPRCSANSRCRRMCHSRFVPPGVDIPSPGRSRHGHRLSTSGPFHGWIRTCGVLRCSRLTCLDSLQNRIAGQIQERRDRTGHRQPQQSEGKGQADYQARQFELKSARTPGRISRHNILCNGHSNSLYHHSRIGHAS
jgi:hypothetical protein